MYVHHHPFGRLVATPPFFAFSPFCHFYNNTNFTGKSVSTRSQDIGNSGKNLVVMQMERHVSVPISCNEKSGAAPENFLWNPAFHLHFNRLNRKFWPNGKRPWSLTLTSISFSPRHWIMSPV